MKISVAMATHNGEVYIERQLDSILNQTLPPCEIVISDDGSTDSTLTIVERYAQEYESIRLLHCKRTGINNNFASALTACSGDYIAFSDQDDIWHKDKLARLSAGFKNSTLLSYGTSILIDENNQMLNTNTESFLGFDNYRKGRQPFYFLFCNCVSGHGLMISKQLIECLLPFSDDCMYDHWIALVASVKSKIVQVPDALTYHRIHSSNTVNNVAGKKESKKRAPKLSKFDRHEAQRQSVLLRIEKGLQEEDGLSIADKECLLRLLGRLEKLNNKFFDIQLFTMLFQARKKFFHGNLVRECRNRATGGRYFRLLDVLLKR